MKHLKTKKIFESFSGQSIDSPVIDDIKDICLELSDDGFNIDIDDNPTILYKYQQNYDIISIVIQRNDGGRFYYKDAKEVVDRLEDYLGDRMYRKFVWEGNHLGWATIGIDSEIDSIRGVKIHFSL